MSCKRRQEEHLTVRSTGVAEDREYAADVRGDGEGTLVGPRTDEFAVAFYEKRRVSE
jgi:hypothetical protein